MTTTRPLADVVASLPPDLQREVRDFAEFLLAKHTRRTLPDHAATNRGWPMGYFERTAGSLTDFPDVERASASVDGHDEDEAALRFDPPHSSPESSAT